MQFPCIKYKLDSIENFRADDVNYHKEKRWAITVIDRNPDSTIYERLIENFDHCSLDRTGVNDNLNHWYLTLFW